MFVKNESRAFPILRRGHVTKELAVAALVVATAYRVHEDRLEILDPAPDPVPSDPPDTSLYIVWEGVSVTAAGSVLGPIRPPFAQPVALRVGEQLRRLMVFGDRAWERRMSGALVPSAPAPFSSIELSFARAFGGGWDVPPGLLDGTDLPHPGFRRNYPWNPGGMGHYPDAERATGAPLPNIERAEQLMKQWSDTPDPGGFTPCRDLLGFRMRDATTAGFTAHMAAGGDPHRLPLPTLVPRMHHHAPPDLIFDELPTGTTIELTGLGPGPLRLTVPPCPVRASVRGRRGATQVPPRLRAVHVNADQQLARIVHEFPFRYNPRRAPHNVCVIDEGRP